MARDCGAELKDFGVTFLSLWPGPVKTELISANQGKMNDDPKVSCICLIQKIVKRYQYFMKLILFYEFITDVFMLTP